MKRKFTNALLLVVAVVLASCGDDDEGPSSYYTLDGSKKTLASGVFFYDDSPGESNSGKEIYYHQVILVSAGIDMTGTSATGTGDLVTLMLASGTTPLETGTHSFVGDDMEAEPKDFVYGDIAVGFNASSGNSTAKYDFTSGTVTVAKSGDIYTIDFEGKVVVENQTQEHTVTGHYSGPLTSILND
jgi:hypothetical protein